MDYEFQNIIFESESVRMKSIRIILAIMSVILIILILIYMNYNDLSWSANKISYLGLAASVLNIWALVFLIKEREQ